jgi:hypothetical protein
LAELFRHVVTGRISKDTFCVEADSLSEASQDHGIEAVYAAVDALHADWSELWPVRFAGAFRLAPEVRRRMAIAAVFLYSDTEYDWPPLSPFRGYCLDGLLACACGTMIFGGIMLLALSGIYPLCFVPLAAVCFFLAAHSYTLSQRLAAKYQADCEAAQREVGDYDVWPFRKRADFDEARRHPPLLGGSRSR